MDAAAGGAGDCTELVGKRIARIWELEDDDHNLLKRQWFVGEVSGRLDGLFVVGYKEENSEELSQELLEVRTRCKRKKSHHQRKMMMIISRTCHR